MLWIIKGNKKADFLEFMVALSNSSIFFLLMFTLIIQENRRQNNILFMLMAINTEKKSLFLSEVLTQVYMEGHWSYFLYILFRCYMYIILNSFDIFLKRPYALVVCAKTVFLRIPVEGHLTHIWSTLTVPSISVLLKGNDMMRKHDLRCCYVISKHNNVDKIPLK